MGKARLTEAGEAEEEEKIKGGDGESSRSSVWDCGSPLYDSFELASFCHILDRHMMKLPFALSRGSAGRMPARIQPEQSEGRITEVVAEAFSTRRLNAKRKRKVWKWCKGVGLKGIIRAIDFWKRLDNKIVVIGDHTERTLQ